MVTINLDNNNIFTESELYNYIIDFLNLFEKYKFDNLSSKLILKIKSCKKNDKGLIRIVSEIKKLYEMKLILI